MAEINQAIMTDKDPLTPKHFVLGLQHLFAMFGATVLVPALTGLNPGIALLCAGLGTLLFHFITGWKVPVFLGSSFAFIGVITAVMQADWGGDNPVPYVQGGIIAAGIVYAVIAGIVRLVGTDAVKKLFPTVVTAPVIVVIGLNLSPSAISDASTCWPLAILVLVTVVVVMCFTKGFFKLVPVLMGIIVGYAAALICDFTGFSNTLIGGTFIIDKFKELWTGTGLIVSGFTLPKFNLTAILLIAPVAVVTFMEHIGDITTNGAVVGKDFFKDPGIHRTLLGDGLATVLAGLLGGPANTTYGENTGVLAVTKMYDPRVIRIAAVYAIILGVFAKFGVLLQTIPTAVMGGICIVLFGMIASVGLRSLADARLDFSNSRNLLIVAIILVLGLGLSDGVSVFGVNLSGLFIATLVGVILNRILPENA